MFAIGIIAYGRIIEALAWGIICVCFLGSQEFFAGCLAGCPGPDLQNVAKNNIVADS